MVLDTHNGDLARSMASAPLTHGNGTAGKDLASALTDALAPVVKKEKGSKRPSTPVVATGATMDKRPFPKLFGIPRFEIVVAKENASDDGMTFSRKMATAKVPFLPADLTMSISITQLRVRTKDATGTYDDFDYSVSMPADGRYRFAKSAIQPADGDAANEMQQWKDLLIAEYKTFAKSTGKSGKLASASGRSSHAFRVPVTE